MNIEFCSVLLIALAVMVVVIYIKANMKICQQQS